MRISKDGLVLYANDASGPLLDAWSTGEGKRLGTYWLTMIRQVLLSGTSEETEVEAGDRFFAVKYTPVAEGGYVNIYGLDITARKEAEEELRRTQSRIAQQERLRALGQMASGIAHDFNNALAPILGFSELALAHEHFLEDTKKMKHYLETIHTAAGDAAEVVRRLREFYRPQAEAGTFRDVDINALIVEVMMVTEPRWKHEAQARGVGIEIRTEFEKLPPVPAEESEIRQVFINMIFNAVDAMPEGGVITFRTRTEECFVVVDVEDTGVGMSKDTVRRCLEPFFTSKRDRGTGLGLSIAHGVIQRHGGSIEIGSEEGKGTAFTLRLSLMHHEEPHPADEDATIVRRGLRILVAEDEPMVREVTEGYLVGDGHTVVSVRDGAEALAAFRAGTFDLVVTDMAMPRMGGGELAAEVKSRSPEIPVVLLTGFGDMARDLTEDPLAADFVLGKPVKLDELRRAIARAAVKESAAKKEDTRKGGGE
jgi:signal transduction histidine kinase/ActR/RegA family two-component response regulator